MDCRMAVMEIDSSKTLTRRADCRVWEEVTILCKRKTLISLLFLVASMKEVQLTMIE